MLQKIRIGRVSAGGRRRRATGCCCECRVDRWKTDPAMKYDKFIEAQVWDDRPIKDLLAVP